MSDEIAEMYTEINDEEIAKYSFRFLLELDDDEVDLQGRLSVAIQMTSDICQECNLTKENFLYLCRQMAEKGKWRTVVTKEKINVRAEEASNA